MMFLRRNFNIIFGSVLCIVGIVLIALAYYSAGKPPGEILVQSGLVKITQSNAQGSILAFGLSAMVLFATGVIFIYEQIRQRRTIRNALGEQLDALNLKRK
jgi:hypothetical protein